MYPSISFRCDGCNARIKAPAQMRGRRCPCPGCGQPLVVQPSRPEDEGPMLVAGGQTSARQSFGR